MPVAQNVSIHARSDGNPAKREHFGAGKETTDGEDAVHFHASMQIFRQVEELGQVRFSLFIIEYILVTATMEQPPREEMFHHCQYVSFDSGTKLDLNYQTPSVRLPLMYDNVLNGLAKQLRIMAATGTYKQTESTVKYATNEVFEGSLKQL